MKKRVWLYFLFIFLIIGTLSSLQAQVNATSEEEKIDKAYQCLTDKVSGKCSTLTPEEKAFSALATGICSGDLLGDSKFKTDVKYTSQAILAMGGNSDGEAWLLSKNATPTELVWYLEIETNEASSCSIQYSGQSYVVNINEDKKLSSNAGNCLVLAQDDYLLRVSSSCYNKEFSISCDKNFLTTTLFKKSTSSTIYVSEETSSAAAGGTTNEKVESYCFAKGNSCDYEASLWAAMVLDSLGTDVSSYLPYLITMADENKKFLPEAFLYALTAKTEYKISLLSKQKSNQWWMESGDKFYDTALALYPLQQEAPIEKTNAKTWLLDSQDSDGCWERNTRNTAFILASLWPEGFAGGGGGDGGETELPDCEDAGYYCTSSAACEESRGEILSEFDCPSLSRCCTTPIALETCAETGGEICSSRERCVGGTEIDASDLRASEICCVEGSCAITSPPGEGPECELSDGICRAGGCADDEEETAYSCELEGDTCCIQKTGTPPGDGKSYWWIWVLLILIILVVIGIIFRDKLRMFWFRMSGGKTKPGPGPPHYPLYHPMPYQRPPMHRAPERRIMPPASAPQRRTPSRSQSELDEVLRKLKEMGK